MPAEMVTALANLVLVEVYAAGLEAMQRRMEAMRPLQELIADGYQLAPQTPPITAGNGRRHLHGRPPPPPRRRRPLAAGPGPDLHLHHPLPLVAPDEAWRIAGGDGRRRG